MHAAFLLCIHSPINFHPPSLRLSFDDSEIYVTPLSFALFTRRSPVSPQENTRRAISLRGKTSDLSRNDSPECNKMPRVATGCPSSMKKFLACSFEIPFRLFRLLPSRKCFSGNLIPCEFNESD